MSPRLELHQDPDRTEPHITSPEARAFGNTGKIIGILVVFLAAGAAGAYVYDVSTPAPGAKIIAAQPPPGDPASSDDNSLPSPPAPQPSTVTPPVQDSQQPASDAARFARNQPVSPPGIAHPFQPQGTPNVADTTTGQQPGVHAPDRAVPESR